MLMKIKSLLLCLLFSIPAFSQGEANNWFFGQFGGLQFQSDGSVTPLAGGMMNTNEGCSTISDADGNLLFYTDGRNVWDSNHLLMPNGNYFGGTGLLGDPSSTQSGIIVPKKGDPNIYYIFTVDEPHHDNATVFPNQFAGVYSDTGETIPNADDGFNNGLNYSIVDLSVTGDNGSIGDVTTRNIHLLTYNPADNEEIKFKCSEKITAIRKGDGSGYWVIAHFIDKFYAFSVDENGVNETPVVTQIAPMVPLGGYRRNALGCIKASPDGDKLAIAHQQFSTIPGSAEPTGAVYVYDLDNMTGVVSNPVQLLNNLSPYGVEFSPQGKKLYVSYADFPGGTGFLHQFDMLSTDIPASGIVLAVTGQPSTLQLGPNGKIYRAVISSQFLDVINNPEEDGALCNYVQQSQPVAGISIFGLPPFITSFFSANMVVQNTCEGQATQFELNVNSTFDSVVWDFGDGTAPSTEEEPVHTYAAAGSYTAIATVTRQGETTEISRDITIATVPVVNIPPAITECDPDNDGIAIFTLNDNTAAILGTQSSAQFDVRYYTSQENADNNISPLNGISYINTANPETIYARIFNRSNNQCYATTSFQVNVANTPVMLGNTFDICDDAADGDDTNGRATFDLNTVAAALVQDIADYPTTFYASETDAQNEVNPLPASFINTMANEHIIYARVVNNTSPECFAIEPITLIVNPLPANVPDAMLVQCDTGVAADGITLFNLVQANNLLTRGNANYETAYYFSAEDISAAGTPIGPLYSNVSNPQTIAAKVTNTETGCYRIINLVLNVNTANTAPITMEKCDQDGTEDGRVEFDLTEAGLEGTADSVVYYAFLHDALQEQNPIAPNYTNIMVNLQSVYARLENNNDCVALQEIKLVVQPLPTIAAEAEAIVCENTGDYVELTSGVSGNTTSYTFEWSTGAITRSIFVNEPGIYSVKVTNAKGCWRIRTITVEASNIATIDDIEIVDLVDNNTVTVYVSPASNVDTSYLYSLDAPEGPYQESNQFEHVTPGFHTVYVYDVNGCGVVEQEIAVLGIPNFFTPNGDGINDTWDIIGMNGDFYENSEIIIFDRFGKVVGTVDPKGKGWDGNYNGRRLPATDYWYVVKLETGRIVKGHFSMIR